LIANFRVAMLVAVIVVAVELGVISSSSPLHGYAVLQAAFQVLGGGLVS